jgi:hypothetical protein
MKFTNKKLLAVAVLAAITAQANAATVTYAVSSSDVTIDVQFGGNFIGADAVAGGSPGTSSSDADVDPSLGFPFDAPAPYETRGFSISGTVDYDDVTGQVVSQNLIFDGGLAINTGTGGDWYVGFQNAGGSYAVDQGLTINSGFFDATYGGSNPGDLADLSANNFDFTLGSVTDYGPGVQNAGFVIDQGGPLNGSDIILNMPGYAGGLDAAGRMTLFGFDADAYMGGTLTLEVAAVPVPAAAWLFGSALLGLAGIGRKRV